MRQSENPTRSRPLYVRARLCGCCSGNRGHTHVGVYGRQRDIMAGNWAAKIAADGPASSERHGLQQFSLKRRQPDQARDVIIRSALSAAISGPPTSGELGDVARSTPAVTKPSSAEHGIGPFQRDSGRVHRGRAWLRDRRLLKFAIRRTPLGGLQMAPPIPWHEQLGEPPKLPPYAALRQANAMVSIESPIVRIGQVKLVSYPSPSLGRSEKWGRRHRRRDTAVRQGLGWF